jgi:NAD(P)-dependent dehydrogenase (short-subunit alcohol dehydrogenase family)
MESPSAARRHGVRVDTLRDEPLVAALPKSHRYASEATIPIGEFVAEPVLLPREPTGQVFNAWLRSVIRAHGFELEQGSGAIVDVASVNSFFQPDAATVDYGAAKAKAVGTDAETIRETAMAAIATGRFTTPREVATLVTMLASDRMANVTGVNYVIDGGLIKTT